MRGWLRRTLTTLQARLLLALALIGILPLAVVGLGAAALQQRTIADLSARELLGVARGLAGEVDVYLDPGPITVARAVASLPDVRSMQPARQEPLLQDLYFELPLFARLATFAASGRRIASSHATDVPLIADRPAFQQALRRGEVVWEVAVLRGSDRPSLIVFAPIRDEEERRVVGVLGGVVALESLSEIVGRVAVGEGGRAFVLDTDGRVLAHPDPAAVRDRRDYSWIGIPGAGRAPGPGIVRYQADGEMWIAGYSPVPSTGWTVVVERGEADVLAPADRAWRFAVTGAITSAFLALAAATWLAGWLARPVRELAVAARALGRGDRTAPLPKLGGDEGEVGALVQAFATMRDAVTAREETLRDETRIIETLHSIGTTLAGQLDLQRLLQATTDATTELSGAQIGAFFYNATSDHGESNMLYTLSGVPREAFERVPMSHNTAIFEPTFRGEGVVRMDDVMRDPLYGLSPPFYGMPEGHLPVRSYLAAPVISRTGEVIGGLFFGHERVGIFTERTERLVTGIASQAAIAIDNARLYAQAREAVRARDEFLSIASHELRTPVTSIKGNAQLLLRSLERGRLDEQRLARQLRVIDDGTDRLVVLIQDLLDVSRIRLGQLALRPREINLCSLVHMLETRYRDDLDGRHRLVLSQDGAAHAIWADPNRLEQVLTNLLDNAVKYSPDGGAIHLNLEPDGDGVLLSVRDEGIGLPEGTAETIFEPFGRAPNAVERQLPGMGLGLHICQSIIEQHGGRIWAESAGAGLGTTMHVWLPTRGLGGEPVADGAK